MRHNPSLDGVRGSAVLIVLCAHYYGVLGIANGYLGVDVFFVLSGFLITSLLLRELETHSHLSFINFYVRRTLRLLPALAIAVLLFGAIDLIFGICLPRMTVLKSMAAAILMYPSNWVRALQLWNMKEFAHTWSLAIEEQFYFIWPITLLVLVRLFRNYSAVFLAVIVAAVAVELNRLTIVDDASNTEWIGAASQTRLQPILAGALAAIAIVYCESITARRALAIVAPFAIVMVIALLLFFSYNYLLWKQQAVSIAVALIILHLSIAKDSWVHRMLSVSWLTYTGRISYGLYLYHYPIWFLTIHTFGDRLPWNEKQALCVLVLAPMSYLMAWASYKYAEAPLLRMKDRFRAADKDVAQPLSPSPITIPR